LLIVFRKALCDFFLQTELSCGRVHGSSLRFLHNPSYFVKCYFQNRRCESIFDVPLSNRGTKNPESFHRLFNIILLFAWKGRQILSEYLSFPIQNIFILSDTRFLFSTSSRQALESTQSPIQWTPEALSPGVKRPGCEADDSPPASVVVKKMWIYTSTLPYAIMA
jgi:hypothetical protein